MYNCEKQIVRVLAQLDKTVCEYISAVIVVNNRSTDNGEQAVTEWLKANRPAVPASQTSCPTSEAANTPNTIPSSARAL